MRYRPNQSAALIRDIAATPSGAFACRSQIPPALPDGKSTRGLSPGPKIDSRSCAITGKFAALSPSTVSLAAREIPLVPRMNPETIKGPGLGSASLLARAVSTRSCASAIAAPCPYRRSDGGTKARQARRTATPDRNPLDITEGLAAYAGPVNQIACVISYCRYRGGMIHGPESDEMGRFRGLAGCRFLLMATTHATDKGRVSVRILER